MGTRRILLADDEAHITHLVSRKLQALEHDVRIAGDGEEAWSIAQEWRPELLITDLQMPYLSGLELATRLRESPDFPRIPVIMLTARGYVLQADQLDKAGIRELLSKPFSVRRLVERAQALLDELPERAAA